MTWSVKGMGRPSAVAEKLRVDFANIPTMSEPERRRQGHH